jgi:hypothetical protein
MRRSTLPGGQAASVAPRDTRIIEIRGRHRLIDEILQPGLEVALPIRDRGVDLIVYSELDEHVEAFTARPIQMKAASGQGFGLDQKYAHIPDLIIAYVWYLADPSKAVTYALTYPEALHIIKALGWTTTHSWLKKGGYFSSTVSADLVKLLGPHRMTPQAWLQKITRRQ